MIKAAIFDLDGVIVDTVPLHFKAWKKMFAEYGVEFNFDEYKKKVDGIPRIDGARAILTDISEQDLQKAGRRKQSYFSKYLKTEKIPVYESTVNLIKELKKKGLKVAVISSSKNCRPILKRVGLIKLFNAVVDGYEITKGKPNPQTFLLAAKKMKIPPSLCIAFEDAVLGVEAVKNAGMICVGIDRYGKPERLKKADIVVNDLSEITFDKIKALANERHI